MGRMDIKEVKSMMGEEGENQAAAEEGPVQNIRASIKHIPEKYIPKEQIACGRL